MATIVGSDDERFPRPDLRYGATADTPRMVLLTQAGRQFGAGVARADYHHTPFGHHMYFSARSTILRRRGV